MRRFRALWAGRAIRAGYPGEDLFFRDPNTNIRAERDSLLQGREGRSGAGQGERIGLVGNLGDKFLRSSLLGSPERLACAAERALASGETKLTK